MISAIFTIKISITQEIQKFACRKLNLHEEKCDNPNDKYAGRIPLHRATRVGLHATIGEKLHDPWDGIPQDVEVGGDGAEATKRQREQRKLSHSWTNRFFHRWHITCGSKFQPYARYSSPQFFKSVPSCEEQTPHRHIPTYLLDIRSLA